jgi:acyl-CoA thioesterase
MALFSDALTIQSTSNNRWAGEADAGYSHPGGQFGGWTAAVLLKSVLLQSGSERPPLSLQVQLVDSIGPGQIDIETEALRSGSRMQFWRAELWQNGKACAYAQVTLATRRKSDAFTDARPPDAPPPEDPRLRTSTPPTKYGAQFEGRWLTESPFSPRQRPHTSLVFWSRSKHRLEMDYALLAMLSDLPPPRILYERRANVATSTVSMNMFFHGAAEEIAEVGPDYVLNEAVSRRCEGGYFDHEARIWSRAGALLLTSEQVVAYRD